MQVLSPQQTRERLPYAALADAIREMLFERAAGHADAPERIQVALADGGTLLLMPAADDEIAMTKLVTVHPRNGDRGLPTIHGEVVVMDARTGVRKGLLDGATVSGRRTAALSLLAAQHLAPVKSGPLLIVGAGTQARVHLEAFHDGLGITEVYIRSRTRQRAEELAEYAGELGVSVRIVDRVEDALADTRLFVAATTSQEPVLPNKLPADAFVAAVGAFTPEMAELPPALISAASVVVDTLEGARAEAGDLIQAAAAGAFRWEDAHALDTVIGENAPRLPGPVLFKSVGHSLWDLAAARLAFAGD